MCHKRTEYNTAHRHLLPEQFACTFHRLGKFGQKVEASYEGNLDYLIGMIWNPDCTVWHMTGRIRTFFFLLNIADCVQDRGGQIALKWAVCALRICPDYYLLSRTVSCECKAMHRQDGIII
jgi:hypothetical protein